jgi:hypothetical protein
MPTASRLVPCLTLALALPAAVPAQPARPISARPLNTGNCAPTVAPWWRAHGDGGRIVCGADPTRPAVLLVHGLHRDARTWTAPSYVEYSYDHRATPAAKTVNGPNAGILKVGTSDWLYGAVFRVYAWMFGAPVVSAGVTTTKATPREIDGASPILDALRDFADELTPGKGDALVSDQRSRLPWSIHTTDQLNHAEVLWDRPLQQRVVQLISPPVRTARAPLKP